ncbi:MAG TPA: hypothetical protein P5083_02610 [Candidatus Paceibacterota bacterium]|nr:hypothetical protein [Candidatus Paceibacterota bacterium]
MHIEKVKKIIKIYIKNMDNPYPIKFEKRKNEQYLTISCIIKDTEEKCIEKIQNTLWEELNNKFGDVKFAKDREELNEETDKSLIIYKYQPDRIHFSLLVITTKSIPQYSQFEDISKLLKEEQSFKEIQSLLTKIIQEEISLNKEFPKTGQIKRIYFPQKIEGSIALNIFIDNFKVLKNLEGKIKERLSKYSLEGEIKLKMYEEKYFAINLIRFISKEKDNCFKDSSIYKKIEKINKILKERPINVSFEARPTISDPYLSNKKPFLDE